MRKSVRYRSARVTGASIAALLMAGSTASAAYADDRQDVDITANYAAAIIPDPSTLTCGGFDVSANGTASGSPIGTNGTWQDYETVCALTLPGQYDINGTAVIGASDGDQISIGYHVTAPVSEGSTIYPSGTFWINGGTGEYAHATGGGTVSAVVNLLDTSHVSATLIGSIT